MLPPFSITSFFFFRQDIAYTIISYSLLVIMTLAAHIFKMWYWSWGLLSLDTVFFYCLSFSKFASVAFSLPDFGACTERLNSYCLMALGSVNWFVYLMCYKTYWRSKKTCSFLPSFTCPLNCFHGHFQWWVRGIFKTLEWALSRWPI